MLMRFLFFQLRPFNFPPLSRTQNHVTFLCPKGIMSSSQSPSIADYANSVATVLHWKGKTIAGLSSKLLFILFQGLFSAISHNVSIADIAAVLHVPFSRGRASFQADYISEKCLSLGSIAINLLRLHTATHSDWTIWMECGGQVYMLMRAFTSISSDILNWSFISMGWERLNLAWPQRLLFFMAQVWVMGDDAGMEWRTINKPEIVI